MHACYLGSRASEQAKEKEGTPLPPTTPSPHPSDGDLCLGTPLLEPTVVILQRQGPYTDTERAPTKICFGCQA